MEVKFKVIQTCNNSYGKYDYIISVTFHSYLYINNCNIILVKNSQ